MPASGASMVELVRRKQDRALHSGMPFDEERFREKVEAALAGAKQVLESVRTPTFPADVDHRYDDKYQLAAVLTNTALAAQLNVLERIGVNEATLERFKSTAATRSVTLRLRCTETCDYEREQEIEQERSPAQRVETTTRRSGSMSCCASRSTTRTPRVVTRVVVRIFTAYRMILTVWRSVPPLTTPSSCFCPG
jgi:hypothetical protein